jgi:CheY-like chemotaxis protein
MSNNKYRAASILLIEDDDVDAMGVERAFKKLRIGNPIIRAKDGVDAFDILARGEVKKPFIILLDLNLPRMGGIEFLANLREDEKWEDTVVFILTTSKDDEDKYAAYKQHVAGYIVKEKLDSGFDSLIELLDHYWRIVELPDT